MGTALGRSKPVHQRRGLLSASTLECNMMVVLGLFILAIIGIAVLAELL